MIVRPFDRLLGQSLELLESCMLLYSSSSSSVTPSSSSSSSSSTDIIAHPTTQQLDQYASMAHTVSTELLGLICPPLVLYKVKSLLLTSLTLTNPQQHQQQQHVASLYNACRDESLLSLVSSTFRTSSLERVCSQWPSPSPSPLALSSSQSSLNHLSSQQRVRRRDAAARAPRVKVAGAAAARSSHDASPRPLPHHHHHSGWKCHLHHVTQRPILARHRSPVANEQHERELSHRHRSCVVLARSVRHRPTAHLGRSLEHDGRGACGDHARLLARRVHQQHVDDGQRRVAEPRRSPPLARLLARVRLLRASRVQPRARGQLCRATPTPPAAQASQKATTAAAAAAAFVRADCCCHRQQQQQQQQQ